MKKLKNNFKLVFTATIFLIAFGCQNREDILPACGKNPTATLSVDASKSLSVKSASGFLIGNNLNECGSKSQIFPLQPKLIRGGPSQPLVPGATYHFLISNVWGFPPTNWGGNGPPYENFPLFRKKIISAVTEFKDLGLDAVTIFDIWNEPGAEIFWQGTELQYHQTFVAAVEAVRSVLPDARIAGPSWNSYNTLAIKNLLDYCVANDCRFDVLSFHELLSEKGFPDETLKEIRAVKDDLIDARNQFVNAPRYASIGLKEIHINEYVGFADQYRPGEFVAYLTALEAGGADLAAHSCWEANDGSINCFNCTIDGFVERDSWTPRPKWWVSKFYAEGVNGRISSSSDNTAIEVLSSLSTSQDTLFILIGHTRQTTVSNENFICLALSIENLPNSFAKNVKISVQNLPGQNETVLPEPETIFSAKVENENGTIAIDLGSIPLHDAWRVLVTPI